ncbi:probable N-acetyltransferase HLS1 isoform X1 [Impatiens glandulifera]|nr:probable N-acetyltransferase HLS1 isoform X1 [Impatiens glandulifera]
MIRGCIKHVGTRFGGRHVKFGCILGLRVSPRHRRMGIGLKLVEAIEEWMVENGAEYTFLATEESNIASNNLFALKCNYVKFSSLLIYVQEDCSSLNNKPQPQNIQIEKLSIDEAIFLHKRHQGTKDMYLADIDKVLNEKPSLGTWVSYLKDDGWDIGLSKRDIRDSHDVRSWATLSIWNKCETDQKKLIIQNAERSRRSSISHLVEKQHQQQEPSSFLFLHGLFGEGDRVGELVESLWWFAMRVAANMNCKAMVTELGFSDPMSEFVPRGISSLSYTNDVWYAKRVSDQEDDLTMKGMFGNVAVDPRDF